MIGDTVRLRVFEFVFLIQSEPETPYFARPVPNGIGIVVIKSIRS